MLPDTDPVCSSQWGRSLISCCVGTGASTKVMTGLLVSASYQTFSGRTLWALQSSTGVSVSSPVVASVR